ncbi:hypothetical protein [Devosia sp.]|uniref:hypothetical protein n=1 Tax=Devosia sp. TaxID=1871048 RepID=UPI003FA56B79
MLAEAEAEARQRGCRGAYIDTFNPRHCTSIKRPATRFSARLVDFPRGRTRSFLSKALI